MDFHRIASKISRLSILLEKTKERPVKITVTRKFDPYNPDEEIGGDITVEFSDGAIITGNYATQGFGGPGVSVVDEGPVDEGVAHQLIEAAMDFYSDRSNNGDVIVSEGELVEEYENIVDRIHGRGKP